MYRERYGLEIVEAIKNASNKRIELRPSSLYTTLHKLEKKGFIAECWEEESSQQRSKVKRKYYRITNLGEKVFQEKQHFLNYVAAWEKRSEA
ncbi:PadR family transcriptional regulator [Okeania sp. SIO1I7]|uniref:PadR family transcriptional regulator n=1 Tax=Okeania sp. SIO1I7 TaxID=2607772 RepID=UPI0013FBD372|nr:PadR family transcriptional regulator [Okeania sp. SIO1I7]NET30254.1 helix-turn-helix transcriptional regulator [Okeania sp. SIO1I7]